MTGVNRRTAGLYLLGLVNHPAGAEYYWLSNVVGRAAESDEAISDVDLDAAGTTWLGDTVSFRWAILRVIEETARHAGHADFIRADSEPARSRPSAVGRRSRPRGASMRWSVRRGRECDRVRSCVRRGVRFCRHFL
jgi:Protein of unknown function (DUF664)